MLIQEQQHTRCWINLFQFSEHEIDGIFVISCFYVDDGLNDFDGSIDEFGWA